MICKRGEARVDELTDGTGGFVDTVMGAATVHIANPGQLDSNH